MIITHQQIYRQGQTRKIRIGKQNITLYFTAMPNRVRIFRAILLTLEWTFFLVLGSLITVPVWLYLLDPFFK
jgi:hypothetical protein